MNNSEWTTADDNVVRLLGQANDPPRISEDFARRVQTRLREVAAERARPRRAARRPARWVALAALLALLALGARLLPQPVAPPLSAPRNEPRLTVAVNPKTPRTLPLGTRLTTNPGERRRVALADGSTISLNEGTIVYYGDDRHLELEKGEIYVEVTPRQRGAVALPFTVTTPHREIQAVDSKFLVRAGDEGTGVAVAQGHVRIGNRDGLLSAGQQLSPKANAVAPTPRLSYLLDWTRDLVVSASPSLVPSSAHEGGALVAVDSQGQSANLSLRKYRIDVHIEDGFARTTIDQTYFNHTLGRLEGTFFFPLPADASLSRLAMYVEGRLMEGGMVERDYGRMVFDRIVTKMKDPALLEWVDGHTFKMHVFPLEARQEKRIVLSYTQLLPNLYDRLSYRFPAGHSLGAVNDWSFHARIKNGANVSCRCDSHRLTQKIDKDDLLLDASGKRATMDRDLVLDWREANDGDYARFSTMTQDGFRYLMLRYRPQLPGEAKRQRRDWVFLFESSAERNPLLARTQVEIVRTLLANAERDDTFAVLAVNAQVHAFAPSPQKATPENIATALRFLERAHLLGALDLDSGLNAAAKLLNESANPVLVHLGSGNAVLGERRAEVLASRIPNRACYVGVGVGKRGARAFMHRAAARGRGYVAEINPDEPVAWRAFDLLATLNTPRLIDLRIADLAGKAHFLCPNYLIAQGEELCAIARWPIDAPLPESICVTGTREDKPFREVLRVASPRLDAAYLPRTWARWEIDRLLAEDAAKNKEAIVALSKAMYVMTPYTSLLVLENEAMYAEYKVDRGRKDHWAMYPCPERIPVIYEPPAPNERIPMDDADKLNREYSELGFFPPAMALKVKGGGGIHPRASNLIINAENNKLEFFSPAMALKVKGTSTIHTRAGNLILPLGTGNDLGGSPGSSSASAGYGFGTSRVGTQWMMNPYQGYLQSAAERELERARVSPPLTEIWSAHSLNTLLRHLLEQHARGRRGRYVPLDEEILHHLNLTTGNLRGNVGLLKEGGTLKWPLPLARQPFEEARENVNSLLKSAYTTARDGIKPDSRTLGALRDNYKKLADALDANVSQMTFDESLEAKRYLQYVESTIEALMDPNVVNFFNGAWKVKARNVADLVHFMRDKGLWFAPATANDLAAYVVVHRALEAYDAGLPYIEDKVDPQEADQLFAALLFDPTKTKRSSLWRQAARIAERRDQYDRAVQYLRRALELDRDRPRDLPSRRFDYFWLLSLSERRMRQLSALHRSAPRDLLDWVMAIADQWRAVDPMDVEPCEFAGRILRLTGERELAWSYVTSPAALQGGNAADWLELALRQHGQNDYDFAERAFAVASSLEPTNAGIVWERALNHRAAGREDAARTLFRQLAQGVSAERYRSFQLRAKRALEEKHK